VISCENRIVGQKRKGYRAARTLILYCVKQGYEKEADWPEQYAGKSTSFALAGCCGSQIMSLATNASISAVLSSGWQNSLLASQRLDKSENSKVRSVNMP
jgi:hypothetical protein